MFEKTVCEPFGMQAAQCHRIIRNCPDTFKTNSWNEAYWKSKLFCRKIGLEHGNYQVKSQNCKCSIIWSNHHFNLRKHICCPNILSSDFFFCLKHLYCYWMTVMRSIYPIIHISCQLLVFYRKRNYLAAFRVNAEYWILNTEYYGEHVYRDLTSCFILESTCLHDLVSELLCRHIIVIVIVSMCSHDLVSE